MLRNILHSVLFYERVAKHLCYQSGNLITCCPEIQPFNLSSQFSNFQYSDNYLERKCRSIYFSFEFTPLHPLKFRTALGNLQNHANFLENREKTRYSQERNSQISGIELWISEFYALLKDWSSGLRVPIWKISRNYNELPFPIHLKPCTWCWIVQYYLWQAQNPEDSSKFFWIGKEEMG